MTTESPPDPLAALGQVAPAAPMRTAGADAAWRLRYPDLYENVQKALTALPHNFTSVTRVNGLEATDVFSYNTALGSAIEIAVVDSLNRLRSVWDPQGRLPTYAFKRSSQSFPDVRLQDSDPKSTEPILIGIEVKGWFALSKEREPSFRYLATPAACAPQDLIVVVPWYFDNVISGTPVLLPLFIEQARFAAETRNFHWIWQRGKGGPNDQVTLSKHDTPYPTKSALCSDRPVHDAGNNFGRIARSGLLKSFVERTMEMPAAGIPIKHWVTFLKVFTDGASPATHDSEMTKLVRSAATSFGLTPENRQAALPFLQALLKAAEE